jgi:hypothetical protein
MVSVITVTALEYQLLAEKFIFEEKYHTNPLVNAMSVGIVKNGETISATAKGTGNPVFFVGSALVKMELAEPLLRVLILPQKALKSYQRYRLVIRSRKKNYWKPVWKLLKQEPL